MPARVCLPCLPSMCTVYAEVGLRPSARAPPKPCSAPGRAHTSVEDFSCFTPPIPPSAQPRSALPARWLHPAPRRLLPLALTCCTHLHPGDNIVTGLVINFLIGLACYIGFVLWRGRFKIYYARLVLPQVRLKPPPLRLGGHWQLW